MDDLEDKDLRLDLRGVRLDETIELLHVALARITAVKSLSPNCKRSSIVPETLCKHLHIAKNMPDLASFPCSG